MTVSILGWIARTAAVGAGLLLGAVVGGTIVVGAIAAPERDGPVGAGAALLLVTAIQAPLLAALAARSSLRGIRLGSFLFVVHFGVQTFLTQIETVFFRDSVGMSWDVLGRVVAAAAITSAFGAVAAALTVKTPASPSTSARGRGLAWRIPVVAVLYVAVYFAFGAAIAWRSSELRAYYANAEHIAQGQLVLLQIGRGALWAGIAFLLVRHLAGSLSSRVSWTALAFSLFAAPQLLFPNGYMPWAVRFPHLIEVTVSNAIFGALAALCLGWSTRETRSAPAAVQVGTSPRT